MASNQVPVAEKARIISETFVVPEKDVERIKSKKLGNCSNLEAFIREGNTKIPFEMVRDIQKKEVAECSPLELKIRYNDENLGVLPNWLNIDEVDSVIWREVHSSWTGQLEPLYSREDIHGACWEHLLLKSKQITEVGEDDYMKFVCHLVKWHISNFYYYHKQHSKYVNFKLGAEMETGVAPSKDSIHRLPEVIYNLNEVDKELREESKFVYVEDYGRKEKQEDKILDSLEEEMDMLHTIKSIKDGTTRDLLSIAAYTLAQLDSFKELYNEAVLRMTDSKRQKFFEALECKDGKKTDFKKILKIIAGKESNTYLKIIGDYLQEIRTTSRKLAEI